MSTLFTHGQWRRDATPDQVVAEVIADPKWGFADDPISFIGYCSIAGVMAFGPRRAFWVEVGMKLVKAANNPFIQAGAVLGGLADELGLR